MDRDEVLALIDRAALEGWTELDLINEAVTELPSEIGQLTQLQRLHLWGNDLAALPTEIGKLTHLRTLNLGGNDLKTLPPQLWELVRLEELDLEYNQLRTLPEEIAQLIQLKSLNLRDTQLATLPREIGELTQLQLLTLSDNDLMSLPPDIGRLKRLRSLDLPSNNLTLLPREIGRLTQLQSLDLWSNRLTSLPPEIGQLRQLRDLNLGENRLTFLPSEIGELTRLEELILQGNELVDLPSEIGQLLDLRLLALDKNQLTSLPSEIGHLTQLKHLTLSRNRLTDLPPEISRLDALQSLNLHSNELVVLRPELGQLSNLAALYVGENCFRTLPSEIGELTKLEVLSVGLNHPQQSRLFPPPESYQAGVLASLPESIAQLPNLSILDLRYNDIPLPPEILERIGAPQTIIEAYFDFVSGQRYPLNEIKMILVGQGSVGKTSLVTCLLDGPDAFDPHVTKTEGIDICHWQLHLSQSTSLARSQSMDIRVNVWDFGGQEIMHATHQFFLTRRTLYLLVLDARLSEAENRLDYWLQIIRSFGGDSPVILVGNKTDQQPLDIDRRGLRDKYPFIKNIIETSCMTGDGIDNLHDAIAEQIPSLPHVFDELLATWFDVKARLEELDADYIPYAQYLEMCREAGVTKSRSQHTLLGFLHDLGVVLHFPGPRLETTNILNPEWVTQGVYRILNSHALFQNDGRLTWDLVTQILDDEAYPRDKHMFIIDMMRRFELCYPFPGQDHAYLVPDLLPKEERYTGDWSDALTFQIHYDVLPSSVMSRFIVRMHRCIKQHTVWRTGVFLTLNGNDALVRADLTDNRITIRVRGPASGRRELLTRIREQLDAIHDTIQGLRAKEEVPLPNHPDLPPVDYKWLRDLERAGRREFTPPGCVDSISVSEVLNGIESPQARRVRDLEPRPTTEYRFYGSQIHHIGDTRTRLEERSRQVDPITGAIVAALAAGVASGAGEVGKKVVVDAYEGLKNAIKRKVGAESDVAEAVEKLEQKPDSEGRKTMLAEEVGEANLAQDEELMKQAQELIAALKETAEGEQALSRYNIQMQNSQVGVIGDNAEVSGGIHFGSKEE